MKLKIRKYSWQLAPQSIKSIRQQVFIDEQQVPPELEWDSTDEIADHYLALLPDNTPIGVARMFPAVTETAHIGRMAIVAGYRGKGVGEQLLHHLIRETAGQFQDAYLSAQEYAVSFYQRCGFHVCSDTYEDAGIPHVDMRCLAPALVATQLGIRTYPMLMGQDDQPWLFDSDHQLKDLVDSVTSQASQRIWLYDNTLDHELYDRHRFRELLSILARKHRLADVRLLIHDDKPLVKRRHQIVELMRRLPSRIQLRLTHGDYPHNDHPFMLADRDTVLYRNSFSKPEGFANFSASHHVNHLADQFQRMWDTASPSAELRELPI